MNKERQAGAEQSVPAVFLLPTSEPFVWIEEQREGYTRYRNSEGRRWEVFGTCIKLGHCMVGAVINGREIETLEEAQQIAKDYTGPDNPITPEFEGCCPFTFKELPKVGEIDGN